MLAYNSLPGEFLTKVKLKPMTSWLELQASSPPPRTLYIHAYKAVRLQNNREWGKGRSLYQTVGDLTLIIQGDQEGRRKILRHQAFSLSPSQQLFQFREMGGKEYSPLAFKATSR